MLWAASSDSRPPNRTDTTTTVAVSSSARGTTGPVKSDRRRTTPVYVTRDSACPWRGAALTTSARPRGGHGVGGVTDAR
ncbi:hypothetical protein GA0115241_101981 [Streptomyces sp. DpondAA-D4]|nr:hypothetical protein YUMDRAFT_00157 [Streptomyces sp. OspMP-M45]SCD44789.1 hypothetical protein GA0115241_101981 [Streptomyces sp. DpondAA-D4]SCE27288.1 hypothetical protein GA0115249_116445 [Streptomyces sp. PpalLS-921]